MKGSAIRKRYILVRGTGTDEMKPSLDAILSRFGARTKYTASGYAILLTDQYQKDSLCRYIEENIPSLHVITVSGTIKKCKSYINKDQ